MPIRFNITITIIALCFHASTNAQFKQNSDKQLVVGTVDSLYSKTLNEQREIWIHLPEDFKETEYYPVVYVLDARQHFYAITGMMKRLLPWQMPKSIVVGILNTERTRDFTTSNVPFSRGRNTKESGGANKFLTFIDTELKPYIAGKYPTENNHTIIGHSTGGLFVVYSFLQNQNVFDNYLAIDPSLWWDNEKLVKETQQLLDHGQRKDKALYVAVANSIGKGLDTVKVRNDTSVPTEQIRANLKFHDILVKNAKKLNFKWEYFKNEDHGSITIPAQYNGLRALFSWFPFPEMWRFNTPKKYSAEELTLPYYKHYEKLSLKMKREIKPNWDLINQIGLILFEDHKLTKRGLAFFKMNLDFYPKESRSYVALGDFYSSQNEILVAKQYYKKAIEIDGNEDAQKKLNKLSP